MDWDWKTIGAFAAVIAAIATISSNAIGHWIKVRRERQVILRKALSSLLQIRKIVDEARRAREVRDSIVPTDRSALGEAVHYKSLEVLDSVVFDQVMIKKRDLCDSLKEIVQSIGGEDPFLALRLSFCDGFLRELDLMQQKSVTRQESLPKAETSNRVEVLVNELITRRTPELPPLSSINSTLNTLDEGIDSLSKLCKRKIRKVCKGYLEKANKHRDATSNQGPEPFGKGILEELEAKLRLVQQFLPKKES